jgi:hypothetical protein
LKDKSCRCCGCDAGVKMRVHKVFNALEMKLPVMGSAGEKHHQLPYD